MLLLGTLLSGRFGSTGLMAGLEEVFSNLNNFIILSYIAVFTILEIVIEKNYCMC